jgi:class 3 adenylate cyclase
MGSFRSYFMTSRGASQHHWFEGTAKQDAADGVMALVGMPIAHEDILPRAMRAALGDQPTIQEYSHTLQAQGGLTLQMRIGIHTGLVVVGKIGDDLRMDHDYMAVEDTTYLPARLQRVARPRNVVISEATEPLTNSRSVGSTMLYTDEWQNYRGSHPSHATVRYGMHEWARDKNSKHEVHCNTCEGAGAAPPTYLRACQGFTSSTCISIW